MNTEGGKVLLKIEAFSFCFSDINLPARFIHPLDGFVDAIFYSDLINFFSFFLWRRFFIFFSLN